MGQLISFGWIVCKWLFCLCGIAWKNITERGRGGAYVPARVAPQGRIRRSSLRTMRVFLAWKRRCANVRAGTQSLLLRFCLRELCVDVRPLRLRLGRLRVDGWRRLGGLRVSVEWHLGGLCMMLGHVV